MSEAIDEQLKAKHGADVSVLNIGPDGEKKVLLAAIMNDKDRAAGRSGVGAVMGSKKLKAIVVKATRKKLDNIADLDALKVAAKNAMDVLKANPVTGSGLRQLGTAVLVNIVNNIGAFPTKNWQESYYDKGDDISGETLAEKYLVKPGACHRCPIACGRVVNVNGKVVGGPEYEPLWPYGGNCGNNDLNVIDECNMLCNEYGLDAISVPCTIAAAMELYQRGYIKEEECAGVPLEWGSTRALVEWTKRMGNPETELDWLMSSGSARLCEHYGHPEYSMSVKKQEMPAYDARAIQGIVGDGIPPPPKAAKIHALRGRKVASSGAPLYRRKVCRQQTVKNSGGDAPWQHILNSDCRVHDFIKLYKNLAPGPAPRTDCK